jgi:hypothetical protein
MPRLILLILPGGLLLYGLAVAFRCRHPREVAYRINGAMGLRCPDCGAERLHPWANPADAPRSTERLKTGIERQQAEALSESRSVGDCLARMESREKWERASDAVRGKYR